MTTSQNIRFYNVQISITSAWTMAFIATSFNIFTSVIELLVSQQIPTVPVWPGFFSTLAGFLIIILLIVFKNKQSAAFAPTLYLCNALVFMIMHLIKNPYYAEANISWTPFQASKIACLFAALISPRYWIGVLMICLHLAAVLIQYFTFSPLVKAKFPLTEPWIIIGFAVAGIFILTHRYRGVALEQENSNLHADQVAAKKIASSFLQLRDVMNTPLQIIELAVAMMRAPNSENEKILPKLERAANDLKAINLELTRYEHEFDWKQENETLNKELSKKQ